MEAPRAARPPRNAFSFPHAKPRRAQIKPMTRIRPTREDEAEILPGIERSAGRLFLQIPELAWIADDDVQSVEDHLKAIAQGASWVAVDDGGAPMGFLSAEVVDDELHIWELAVRYPSQGSGLGRALVSEALAAARQRGLAAVTLTTFRDLSWNEPFYQRLGFKTLDPGQAGERLNMILRTEADRGIPIERRCAMRYTMGGEI